MYIKQFLKRTFSYLKKKILQTKIRLKQINKLDSNRTEITRKQINISQYVFIIKHYSKIIFKQKKTRYKSNAKFSVHERVDFSRPRCAFFGFSRFTPTGKGFIACSGRWKIPRKQNRGQYKTTTVEWGRLFPGKCVRNERKTMSAAGKSSP